MSYWTNNKLVLEQMLQNNVFRPNVLAQQCQIPKSQMENFLAMKQIAIQEKREDLYSALIEDVIASNSIKQNNSHKKQVL